MVETRPHLVMAVHGNIADDIKWLCLALSRCCGCFQLYIRCREVLLTKLGKRDVGQHVMIRLTWDVHPIVELWPWQFL
jgi:hypothetical protein